MFNYKQAQNHRPVKGKVMEAFAADEDMLRNQTETWTCLLAMKFNKADSIHDVAKGELPFKDLVKKIAKFAAQDREILNLDNVPVKLSETEKILGMIGDFCICESGERVER